MYLNIARRVASGSLLLWIAMVHAHEGYSQSNSTSWTRDEDGGYARVAIGVFAETPLERVEDFDGLEMEVLDDTFAADSANAMTGSGDLMAVALSLAQANQSVAPGQSTSAPTADTVMSAQFVATSDGSGVARAGLDTDVVPNQAITEATYTVTNQESQDAWLHGSIYLTAIQQLMGAVIMPNGFVYAEVNGWFAQAEWTGPAQGWRVTASLPGGIEVDKFVEGVNEYFNFVIPINPANFTLNLVSDTRHRSVVTAGSVNPQSTINGGYSAAAWGVLTPVGVNPLDGDFTGNGVVDGDDFTIFSANIGTMLGSTLSRGDGNHDGKVDGGDFLMWQSNFGSTYSGVASQLTNGASIPEPTSQWICLALAQFVVTKIRAHLHA